MNLDSTEVWKIIELLKFLVAKTGGDASSANQVLTNVKLDTLIANLSDGTETIWKDANNVIVVRRVIFDEELQTFTVSYVLPNNTVFVPTFPLQSTNVKNEVNILDEYSISRVDSSGIIKYYGFIKPNDECYIMKHDTTTSNEIFTYFKASNNFLVNWGNKAILTYDEFNNIF